MLITFGVFSSIAYSQEPLIITDNFYATGFMGDGEIAGGKYVVFNEAFVDKERPDSTCLKITYRLGPKRWAGVYWLNAPDNWGDKPGEDLSSDGFTKITFWAKGSVGGEIVEFKAGGVNTPGKPHKDSFTANYRPKKLRLTSDWKEYTISLANRGLSSVIGGFCWSANDSGNPNGLTFFLDDAQFEGDPVAGN